MKIAIDESGDSGRKFWKGSSKWFILAAVIVPDDMVCGPVCVAVDDYRQNTNSGYELHFAHNSHEQHVNFFEYMKSREFIFASICIDKQSLAFRQPQMLRSKMVLYKFAFEKLFTELKPWLDHPTVLIDTNGPTHFNKALSNHLLRIFGSKHKGDINSIEQIRAVDSKTEPLVQLADYVAGAIHHHVDGRHTSNTYEVYLQNKGKIFIV